MTDPADASRLVVDALRRVAVHDATRYLLSRERQAWQQAEPAAEELIGRLVPGRRPRQRRIARVLTGWYLQVYRAGLDATTPPRDGQVDAAAVDRVGAVVATHLGPTARPDSALTVAAVVWRRARYDAAREITELWTDLDAAAAARAHQLVPAPAVGGDELRPAILQQWYRRVYLNQVRAELGLLTPLRQVSDAEAAAVAAAVTQRRPYRLVGADGVPLMTSHGTVTTDADRRLDAGQTDVVDAPLPTDEARLQRRAAGFWAAHTDPAARLDLARAAFDLPPRWVAVLAGKQFHQLAHVHQLAVMREYVRQARASDGEPARFVPAELAAGAPTEAAAAMFNLAPTPPEHASRSRATLALHRSPSVDAEVRAALALAAAGFSRLDHHHTDPAPQLDGSRPQPSSPVPGRRR